MSSLKIKKYKAIYLGTSSEAYHTDQGGCLQHIRGACTSLENEVDISCLSVKKLAYYTPTLISARKSLSKVVVHLPNNITELRHEQNTLQTSSNLKTPSYCRKQSDHCSWTSISQSIRAFLLNPVHTHSIPYIFKLSQALDTTCNTSNQHHHFHFFCFAG